MNTFKQVQAFDVDHPKGVVVTAFADVTGKDRTLLEQALDPSVKLTHGLFIRIPKDTRLDMPVVLHLSIAEKQAATQVVVVVGAGAQATLIERLDGGSQRWSHAADVIVEDGASVEYVSLQTADPSVDMQLRHRSLVGAGASISWRNATIGGATVTHDLRSQLQGDHAASSVDWIAYAKDKESQRLSARNIFTARDGRGEITMKGVAENKALVACNGMIDIGLNGRGTDTYLTQDVLMLDPTARVDAIPGLEIKTNDVKASHSATVSRVTDEDLFYFGARGIPPAAARRMYIEGFLGDLTARISDFNTREDVLSRVNAKYHGSASVPVPA